RVLVLQDAVTRALQTCDDALARIADARREALKRSFVPQESPVWAREPVTGGASARAPAFAAPFASKVDNLRTYVSAYRGRLVVSGLIIVALMILLRRLPAKPGAGAEIGDEADPALSVVRTPYAGAILIGLLVTRPLRPNPTFEFQQ